MSDSDFGYTLSEINNDSYYEDLIAGIEGLTMQRGMIEMKVELKVPAKIKHAYQEQNFDQR